MPTWKSGARWRVVAGLFVALAMPATEALAGGVYRWVDKAGVTHYSNVPGEAQRASARPVDAAQTRPARPSVFKYRDASGVTHYTDRRPMHRNYVVINVYCPACDPHSKVNWGATRLNLTAFQDEIQTAAAANGVDPALVRAIIHAESSFNPGALSRKGAQGLMQLMPAVASEYGVADAFNAGENIRAGVAHLAQLLRDFNGDVRLVAAAYNAGPGAVRKYGGVPPYEETQVYVERVGVLHRRYQTGS